MPASVRGVRSDKRRALVTIQHCKFIRIHDNSAQPSDADLCVVCDSLWTFIISRAPTKTSSRFRVIS